MSDRLRLRTALSEGTWELHGTLMIDDPAWSTFAPGRQVTIRNDKPMIFPLRWFYHLRELLTGRTYPQVVVWSGRISNIRWEQEAEGEYSMTGQVESVDVPAL